MSKTNQNSNQNSANEQQQEKYSAKNYANRANLEYVDGLYQAYKQNADSVDPDWKRFFEGFDFAIETSPAAATKGTKSSAAEMTGPLNNLEFSVYNLINAYREYGHFEAHTNPLENAAAPSEQLSLKRFQLKDEDLDKTFQVGKLIGKPNATLREIIAFLRACYCGKLTVQVSDSLPDIKEWFIKEFEQEKSNFKIPNNEKVDILKTLTRAEILEKFIHTRYVGTKRFSVEGGDSLLPMLETLAQKAPLNKISEIFLGMAHRGRINVLANFMNKGHEYLFADFNGPTELEHALEDYDGDVKYHLGHVTEKKGPHGSCKVSLAFNPSHLETVDPIILGMARAAQRKLKDTKDRKQVLPILIHGDAAFAGQGVVAETFQLSQVRGYRVGGTIHIVVDNQIGFTTNPENSRSSHYASDISKIVACPVLHVNGDDVESCVRAMDLALRFRQTFGRDIVINMVCYRRYGHNEGDEPAYTQPIMYDIIKKQPTVREIYSKQLAKETLVETAASDKFVNDEMDHLQKIFDATKKAPPKMKVFKFEDSWKGLRRSTKEDFYKKVDTTFPIDKLKNIAKFISEYPANFHPHPKLLKLLETRKAVSEGKEAIDWGTAELLAYGTLLQEGTSVRLTGQDCIRGTFTHRHAGLYDHKTNESYMALKHLNPEKTEFCVYDSVLSEYAVLGFEYGNAVCDPKFLTMWEAQFGDFANGAQIVIDQYLSSSESKWQQMCGLVLLLPHGYEGQGPEHSSARPERFLQLCAQNNMTVANLTTPAQIYHILRRQVKREFRKPLVIMTPKSLLRHPKAVSSLEELSQGTFQEVIFDSSIKDPKKVETVVFSSGKVYYDLLEEREKTPKGQERTALVRLEQIYPFPDQQIKEVLKTFSKAKNIVWCQEEPKNMGYFQNVYFKFTEVMETEGIKGTIKYVGRAEKASPATGSIYRHKAEQAAIVAEALKI